MSSGVDPKREFDQVRQYGYVNWVVPPPFDVIMDMIPEAMRYARSKYGIYESFKLAPKLFMTADGYGIHEIPLDELLVKKPEDFVVLWQFMVHEYRKTPEWRMIRAYTTGSEHMSFYAGVWAVVELLKSLEELSYNDEWVPLMVAGEEALEKLNTRLRSSGKNGEGEEEEENGGKRRRVRSEAKALAMAPASMLTDAHKQALRNMVKKAAMNVLEGVEALSQYESALNELMARFPGIAAHSKGLEPASILYAEPEEIRRRARVLRNVSRLVDEFKERIVEGNITGIGYPTGYDMSNKPFEFAVKEFLYPEPIRSIRLVTQHLAMERRSGRRFNIYIDRSGSMAGYMPGSSIEKVSVAAALAISLILQYGEDVSVYAFDVGLHEIGRGSLTIEPLLALAADGGTSVATALEHAASQDSESIIITDAIDPDVNLDLAMKALEKGRLIILEPASYYDWAEEFIKAGRAIIARTPGDVIEFVGTPGNTGGT